MSEKMKILSKDFNKEAATNNLHIKLKVLNHFVHHGAPWKRDNTGSLLRNADTGHRILDVCPTSAIQFSRWTLAPNKTNSLLNCPYVRNDIEANFGFFTSHGQDSLSVKTRPHEYAQAKQLFTAIKKVIQNQLAAEHNANYVSLLKTEVERYKAAAHAQATMVIRAIRQKGEIEKEIAKLTRANIEATELINNILSAKDLEILRLTKQIATLKKEIREISGFKGVDGGMK